MLLFHFKANFYLPEHQQGRYRIWKMPTSLSFSYFFPATAAISRQQTFLSLPFHFLHVAALTGVMSIAEEFILTERLWGFCEQKSAVIDFTKKAQCLFQTPCVLSSTLSNACNERPTVQPNFLQRFLQRRMPLPSAFCHQGARLSQRAGSQCFSWQMLVDQAFLVYLIFR